MGCFPQKPRFHFDYLLSLEVSQHIIVGRNRLDKRALSRGFEVVSKVKKII
jgi:hypothetical protein